MTAPAEGRRRGRPTGTSRLTRSLARRIVATLVSGVSLKHALAAHGVPERTGHNWRARGERLNVEFFGDLRAVPPKERIYLHFWQSLQAARSRGIAELVSLAHKNIRSTTDALKLLAFLYPDQFGKAALRRA